MILEGSLFAARGATSVCVVHAAPETPSGSTGTCPCFPQPTAYILSTNLLLNNYTEPSSPREFRVESKRNRSHRESETTMRRRRSTTAGLSKPLQYEQARNQPHDSPSNWVENILDNKMSCIFRACIRTKRSLREVFGRHTRTNLQRKCRRIFFGQAVKFWTNSEDITVLSYRGRASLGSVSSSGSCFPEALCTQCAMWRTGYARTGGKTPSPNPS